MNNGQITAHFLHLTKQWNQQKAGDLQTWTTLFVEICKLIQEASSLKGLEKADFAITIITECAETLIEQNPGNFDDQTISVIKQLLTPTGLGILRASTQGLKLLLRKIDTNQDGEISKEELKGCLKSCFPCCFADTP